MFLMKNPARVLLEVGCVVYSAGCCEVECDDESRDINGNRWNWYSVELTELAGIMFAVIFVDHTIYCRTNLHIAQQHTKAGCTRGYLCSVHARNFLLLLLLAVPFHRHASVLGQGM